MRFAIVFVLCLLPMAACRTWDVQAFGVPVSSERPQLMAASDSGDLSLAAQIGISALIVVGAVLLWSAALD